MPPEFTEPEGIAFVRRQWSRLTNGEGLALAIAEAESDRAVGHLDVDVHSAAGHRQSNTASMRVLETAGFQREGYLRSYLAIGDGRADAYIYSLLATDLA